MRSTFDNFDKGGMWDMYVSNIDHPDAKLYWEGLSTVNSPSGILKQGSHYKYEPCQPNEFSSHIVKAAFVSFSLPLCSTKPLFFSQGMSSSLSFFLVILFNSFPLVYFLLWILLCGLQRFFLDALVFLAPLQLLLGIRHWFDSFGGRVRLIYLDVSTFDLQNILFGFDYSRVITCFASSAP